MVGYIVICLAGLGTGYACDKVNVPMWGLGCATLAIGWFLFARKWEFFRRADVVVGKVRETTYVRMIRNVAGNYHRETISFMYEGKTHSVTSKSHWAEPVVGQKRLIGIEPQNPERVKVCELNTPITSTLFIGLVMQFGALSCCWKGASYIFVFGVPIGWVVLCYIDEKWGSISRRIYIEKSKWPKIRKSPRRKKQP